VSAREVAFAQSYIARGYAFEWTRRPSVSGRSSTSGSSTCRGTTNDRSVEHIRAVNVDEVNAALRRRFSAKNLLVTVVASAKELQPALEKRSQGSSPCRRALRRGLTFRSLAGLTPPGLPPRRGRRARSAIELLRSRAILRGGQRRERHEDVVQEAHPEARPSSNIRCAEAAVPGPGERPSPRRPDGTKGRAAKGSMRSRPCLHAPAHTRTDAASVSSSVQARAARVVDMPRHHRQGRDGTGPRALRTALAARERPGREETAGIHRGRSNSVIARSWAAAASRSSCNVRRPVAHVGPDLDEARGLDSSRIARPAPLDRAPEAATGIEARARAEREAVLRGRCSACRGARTCGRQ